MILKKRFLILPVLTGLLFVNSIYSADKDIQVEYKAVTTEMHDLAVELRALENKALDDAKVYTLKDAIAKARAKYKKMMVKKANEFDPKAGEKFTRYNELKAKQKKLKLDLLAGWSADAEIGQLELKINDAKKALDETLKDIRNLRTVPSQDSEVNRLKKEVSALKDKLKEISYSPDVEKWRKRLQRAKKDYEKKLASPEIKKYRDRIQKAEQKYREKLASGKSEEIKRELNKKNAELDGAIVKMLVNMAKANNEEFRSPEDIKEEVKTLMAQLGAAKKMYAKGKNIRDITGDMKKIIKAKK